MFYDSVYDNIFLPIEDDEYLPGVVDALHVWGLERPEAAVPSAEDLQGLDI